MVTKKKRCKYCENTTEVLIHSLADIEWSCVQFDEEEKVFACPNHQKEIRVFIEQTIRDREDEESSKRYLEDLYKND